MNDYLSYFKYTSYLGSSTPAGSTPLANILYNMDTFNVDVSNLRTIDNAGSDGATADGLMYGSNHIYLGATQSVTYTTVNTGDYAYFDVTTKAHVKATATGATTTISTPTHHSNFFSLKAGKSISAGDITELNANPEDIARMVKGVATVGTYSFTLADIEAFYPGNEGDAMPSILGIVQGVHPAYTNTNLFDYSELFDGTGDLSPQGTIVPILTPNATTAPDATTTATLIVPQTGADNSRLDSNNVVAPDSNADICFSVYVKAKELTNIQLKYLDWGVSSLAEFNASTGQIVTSGGKYCGIYSVGNGWYRCFISFDLVGDGIGDFDVIIIGTPDSVSGLYLWGAQYEQGSLPTDYVKTTGTPTTQGTPIPIAEILNVTSSSSTTYKNTNYGASNFLYTQDATGRLTGMHTTGHIKSGTDGRNITIAMTTPYNHVVTKDIDKIEGNLTSCTITYSDTTTLVVP